MNLVPQLAAAAAPGERQAASGEPRVERRRRGLAHGPGRQRRPARRRGLLHAGRRLHRGRRSTAHTAARGTAPVGRLRHHGRLDHRTHGRNAAPADAPALAQQASQSQAAPEELPVDADGRRAGQHAELVERARLRRARPAAAT